MGIPDSGVIKLIFISLKKFINIDKKLIVYPGHGRETNIEDEIKHNPFLAEEE